MKPEINHFQEALSHLQECTDVEDFESLAAIAIRKWAFEKTKIYLEKNNIQLKDDDNIKEVADEAASYILYHLDTGMYSQAECDWEISVQNAIDECGQIIDDELEDEQ